MNSTKKLNLTTLQNCKVFNTFGVPSLTVTVAVFLCVSFSLYLSLSLCEVQREMATGLGDVAVTPVMLVNLCASQ